jgi:hypothetical protein
VNCIDNNNLITDFVKSNGLIGGIIVFLIWKNPDFAFKMIESQGLVGGLLIFFIFQNQGVLKRLETVIQTLLLCKNCPFLNPEKKENNDVESKE